MDKLISPDEDYKSLLQELKLRIRQAQLRAALSVNQELVLLYWNIGQEILERPALFGVHGEGGAERFRCRVRPGGGDEGLRAMDWQLRVGIGRFRPIDRLDTAVRKGGAHFRGERGVRFRRQRQDEHVGFGQLQGRQGGGDGVAQVGSAALAAVLLGAQQAEVGVLVEERQDREMVVVQDRQEGAARRGVGGLRDGLQREQRRAQSVGDDGEILCLARLAQPVEERGVLAAQRDGGGDRLAADGRIGQHAPGGCVGGNRRAFEQGGGVALGGGA